MNRQENVKRFLALDHEIGRHERDAEAARWEQARLASEAVAAGMTQADYAQEVGKSRSHIRALCTVWKKWGPDVRRLTSGITFTDAYRMAYTSTDDVGTSLESRRKHHLPASPDRAVEQLTEDLLANPQVAKEAVTQAIARSSPAQRGIESAVQARQRERQAEAAARRQARAERQALPIRAHIAAMVVKMNDWALELGGLYDEIDVLAESGADLDTLANAAENLAQAADAWVKVIRRRKSHLHQVIDVG